MTQIGSQDTYDRYRLRIRTIRKEDSLRRLRGMREINSTRRIRKVSNTNRFRIGYAGAGVRKTNRPRRIRSIRKTDSSRRIPEYTTSGTRPGYAPQPKVQDTMQPHTHPPNYISENLAPTNTAK